MNLSAYSGIARLFSPSPKHALTTLLYHRFRAPDEPLKEAKSRLKFQLEWLREKYNPLSADQAHDLLKNGSDIPYPLHVTADDAFLDLLDVQDIFSEFEIPITIFICSGWIDNNETEEFSSLARIADFIRWYDGESMNIEIGEYEKILLSKQSRDVVLDQIITKATNDSEEYIQNIWDYLKSHRKNNDQRMLCNWSELKHLSQDSNIVMGSHSVTHCPLANTSLTRLKFELQDSKRTLEKHFGNCEYFAYPFGTQNVVNDQTTSILKDTGYKQAYLTHAGFANQNNSPYHIPRIVIPDHKISLGEFKARVKGGKIFLDIFT